MNPNRVLIEIKDEAIEKYILDLNSQLGNRFMTLNESKNIFYSIIKPYNLEENFSFCKIVNPDADYILKQFHDAASYRFKKESEANRYNLIKYIVEDYGNKFSKFFIQDLKNKCYYKMNNYSHGLIHFFNLINASFLHYDKEQEILFIPTNYTFPIEIEKALIIKSGLLPKLTAMDSYSNFKNSMIKEMKAYQNISKDDLILLEKTLNQKAKFLIEQHYA